MRVKRVFGALLLMLPLLLPAQGVSIAGKTNKPNSLVRLLTYNDMFTLERTTAVETYSDAHGDFTLNADIKEITPAQIAVNLDRVDVVLTPSGNYDLEVFVPEKKHDASFYEQARPSLKINSAEDNGLMRQLIAAELLINDYVYENMDAIYRGRKAYLIDTLQNRINKTIGKDINGYVGDFVRYKLASVRMAVVSGGAKKIISQYFDSQPVLYSQSAYMELFNEAFEGYFKSREFDSQEFAEALFSGYGKFSDYLKKNDFMARNPQLAELILMKYLCEIYYENQERKTIATEYLNAISKSSKYLKNKMVASAVLTRLQRLSYDTEAPSFSLKNENGEVVSLSDYQEKMVLLQFVDRVSDMTSRQFEALNVLQHQWSDTVAVVTIATKESFDDFKELFYDKWYEWQLLNLDDDILLLEKYNVMTSPEYVIIKKKGRIGMAPAPTPDHYLDYHVRRISGYR